LETKFTYLITKDKVEKIQDLDFVYFNDYLVIEEFKDIKGSEMEDATEFIKQFNTLDQIYEINEFKNSYSQKIVSLIKKLNIQNFFLEHCTDNENFGLPIWSSLLIVKNKLIYETSDLYDVKTILDYDYYDDIL